MADKDHYDLVVIGSGPGGYVASIRGARVGMNVALVERDRVGGVCLNYGCIPTKTLLQNTEVLSLFQRSKEFGITVDNLMADFSKAVDRSRRVANRLSKGVEYLLKKNKIDLISGSAMFHSHPAPTKKIGIIDEKGKYIREITGRNIIIATGSRVKSVPGVNIDGKKIITSNEAILLKDLPESMIILGGGAIGVEFAYIFAIYGVKVTIIEMLPHILPLEDSEITAILERSFKKIGIDIMTGYRVESVMAGGKGVKVTVSSAEGTSEEKASDIVLVATGREPNSEGIGLKEMNINMEKGYIKVNNRMETGAAGIYAIGDVAGQPLLAHAAMAEGITAVETINGKEGGLPDRLNIPNCTYCHPQVASVGLSEEEAKKRGYDIKIGRFPFRANGKAVAMGETDGMIKIIANAKNEEILGAHIIGPEATELIGEIALAKSFKLTPSEISKTVHAHPTLSEMIMEASGAIYEDAIHI
ncbi:MAG: dihydrolipoyl dehydrogenase [Nitrospinota bacterium]